MKRNARFTALLILSCKKINSGNSSLIVYHYHQPNSLPKTAILVYHLFFLFLPNSGPQFRYIIINKIELGGDEMEEILCLNCHKPFLPSPRHKNQLFCMQPACRLAKKATWKQHKMRTDHNFCESQKLSNSKWRQNNPNYWKDYRKRNPKKVQRNRILQTTRNRKRNLKKQPLQKDKYSLIAKVDSSISNNIKMIGRFWLVPLIAKVYSLMCKLDISVSLNN